MDFFVCLMFYIIAWTVLLCSLVFIKVKSGIYDQPYDITKMYGKKTLFFIRLTSIPVYFVVIISLMLMLMLMCMFSSRNRRIFRYNMIFLIINTNSFKLFQFLERIVDTEEIVDVMFLFPNVHENLGFCLSNKNNIEKIIKYTFWQSNVNNRNVSIFIQTFVKHVQPVKIERILRNISNDYAQRVLLMHPYNFPLYNFALGVYVSKIRNSKNYLATFPKELIRMLKKFIVY